MRGSLYQEFGNDELYRELDAEGLLDSITLDDSKRLLQHCSREDGPLCSAMSKHEMDIGAVLRWRTLLLESAQGEAARAVLLEGPRPGLQAVSTFVSAVLSSEISSEKTTVDEWKALMEAVQAFDITSMADLPQNLARVPHPKKMSLEIQMAFLVQGMLECGGKVILDRLVADNCKASTLTQERARALSSFRQKSKALKQ